MFVPTKFAMHAAQLLAGHGHPHWPHQPDLPEDPKGGRLPEPRGPAVYGTDPHSSYNGTGTVTSGKTTAYYWPI
jgi:hypothetical protein